MNREDIKKEYDQESKDTFYTKHSIDVNRDYIFWLENKRIEDSKKIESYFDSLSSVCLQNIELKQKIDILENKIIELDSQILKEI